MQGEMAGRAGSAGLLYWWGGAIARDREVVMLVTIEYCNQ